MKEILVGIDLGTSNSCMAIFKNGKIDMIKGNDGNITPSVVYYEPFGKNNKVMVGSVMNHNSTHPKNCIFDAKRFIGQTYSNNFIQQILRNYPFDVTIKDGSIKFKIQQRRKESYKSPEEVGSEILKYFKECILTNEDDDATVSAVLTVPAYFTTLQRKATLDAARKADINIACLLQEPTAAAIFHLDQIKNTKGLSMVFDLGGGTFDISIVEYKNGEILVRCVDGDNMLGGVDIDELVTSYFEDQFKKNGVNVHKEQRNRLKNACKILKENLSINEQCKTTVDEFLDDGSEAAIEMSRKRFEELINPLLQRCVDKVESCLNKSNIQKEDVKNVILVGGTTKIPKVKQRLLDFFKNDIIIESKNPDESVAAGAAIYAYMQNSPDQKLTTTSYDPHNIPPMPLDRHNIFEITESNQTLLTSPERRDKFKIKNESIIALEKFKITEVCSMSISTNSLFDYAEVAIEANSKFPISKEETWKTSTDNQSSMAVEIFEGNWKNCNANILLGKVHISDIPKDRLGNVKVKVIFNMDTNGLLKIKTVVEQTKREEYVEIQIDKSKNKEPIPWSEQQDIEFEDKTLLKKCYYFLRCKLSKESNGLINKLNEMNKSQILVDIRNFVPSGQPNNNLRYLQRLNEVLNIYNNNNNLNIEQKRKLWMKIKSMQ